MIPSDVASSLRSILPDRQTAADAQTTPVAPAQKLADVLSNLVPGQRILAEIQALLPSDHIDDLLLRHAAFDALPGQFEQRPLVAQSAGVQDQVAHRDFFAKVRHVGKVHADVGI